MWYDSILGIGSTPDSTAANSTLNGATSSNGGSNWGTFLAGIGNLATTGVQDYSAIKGAIGSKSSGSASTNTATASTLATVKWLPWVLIGGVVLVIVALLFGRGR